MADLRDLHEFLGEKIHELSEMRDSLASAQELRAEDGLRAIGAMILDFYRKNRMVVLYRLDQSPKKHRHNDSQLQIDSGTLMAIAKHALTQFQQTGDQRMLRHHLLCEELGELADAMANCNEVEALDALSDLQYVLSGTAVTLDLPLAEGFCEAHRSNMTKSRHEDDEGLRNNKGPDYVPADFERVLREYREQE